MSLVIDNQLVNLAELRRAWLAPVELELGINAQRRIAESNETVRELIRGGTTRSSRACRRTWCARTPSGSATTWTTTWFD